MKLTNTYQKIREDYYSWTVSVEGTEQELAQINNVTYHLHESFPSSVLVSNDPVYHFRRSTMGWGEFLLKAEAEMKDGGIKKAELWLDLGFEHTRDKKQRFTGEFNS